MTLGNARAWCPALPIRIDVVEPPAASGIAAMHGLPYCPRGPILTTVYTARYSGGDMSNAARCIALTATILISLSVPGHGQLTVIGPGISGDYSVTDGNTVRAQIIRKSRIRDFAAFCDQKVTNERRVPPAPSRKSFAICVRCFLSSLKRHGALGSEVLAWPQPHLTGKS